MNNQRRQVLKGMVLTGSALGSLGSSVTTWASPVQQEPPLHVILTPGQCASAFLSGVQAYQPASAPQVLYTSTDLSFLRQWQTLLEQTGPKKILGLVDDASATIVIDLLRSAQGRLHWQAHHARLSPQDSQGLGAALAGTTPRQSAIQNTHYVNGHHVSLMLEI